MGNILSVFCDTTQSVNSFSNKVQLNNLQQVIYNYIFVKKYFYVQQKTKKILRSLCIWILGSFFIWDEHNNNSNYQILPFPTKYHSSKIFFYLGVTHYFSIALGHFDGQKLFETYLIEKETENK